MAQVAHILVLIFYHRVMQSPLYEKDTEFLSTQPGVKSLDGKCKLPSSLPSEEGGDLSGHDTWSRSAAWSLLTQQCVTSLLNSKVVLKVDSTDSSLFVSLKHLNLTAFLPAIFEPFWWNLVKLSEAHCCSVAQFQAPLPPRHAWRVGQVWVHPVDGLSVRNSRFVAYTVSTCHA